MNRSALLLAVAVIGLWGCGRDCEDICVEAETACSEEATKSGFSPVCELSCANDEMEAENTGCAETYGAWLDCTNEADICGAGATGACTAERSSFTRCVALVCQSAPSRCR